jgi:hypothetical protein
MLVLKDGSALPSFMTYDVYTKELTIIISASYMPVKYTVKACAYLNDRVTTAKSDCKEIEVFPNFELTLVSEPKIKVTYMIGESE